MNSLDDFANITLRDEPLAPLTWLKVGGPAQRMIQPRSVDELVAVVRTCHENSVTVHVLGGGSNLLVRDEGVSGVVIRLSDPVFSQVSIEGTRLRAGAGAMLSHVISESVKGGLAGLDTLVGIPGTIAGAIKGNAGGRRNYKGGRLGKYDQSRTIGS